MFTVVESAPRQFRTYVPQITTVTHVCPECLYRLEIPHGKVTPNRCPHCYEDGVVVMMVTEQP